jgi:hypothetical protein
VLEQSRIMNEADILQAQGELAIERGYIERVGVPLFLPDRIIRHKASEVIDSKRIVSQH